MAVTLITGASSGLGAGLAPLFAADGDTVILTARRVEKLEALAAQITAAGGRAVPMALDVTDREAVHATVRAIEAAHGPVDLLIANAGVGKPMTAAGWNSEDLEWQFRTNVFGISHCLEAVLPGMVARRSGHVVGVASLAGLRGLPGSGPYAATKAAVISMMESLRIELRRHGVTVTTINPGFVKTEMTAKNRFPMPFLMELEDAARIMHRGIRRKKSEISFPWQLSLIVRWARFVPNWLYDRALGRQQASKG